ncbi:MAG: S24/S26 family peptidase [Myxococcota bacterium]
MARARVATASMRPLIWPRTVLALRRCTAGELAVGDPVLFRGPDGDPCLHRVIGRRHGRLLVRGDANRRPDPPLDPEGVLGTVQGLVLGRWQWTGAPRPVQRAGRRALLLSLPAVRLGFGVAVRAVRAARGMRG